MERWIDSEGAVFLKEIGIKKGQTVVDFGCGEGVFSIPAAKAAGSSGKVYALDRDSAAIFSLLEEAKKAGLKNIQTIKPKDLRIPLKNECVDTVLLYDVLHYMVLEDRKKIYGEIRRILLESGILSVYPKHNEKDSPLWNLADMRVEEISDEIEKAGFRKMRKIIKKIPHDGSLNSGVILNFTKD